MKIEKLYTSIQFGLYLKSLTTTEFCDLSGAEKPRFRSHWTTEQNALDFMRIDAIILRLRNDYDKFLLQPLKKIMSENKDLFKRTFLKDVGFGTKDVRANKIRIGYINKGGDFQSAYKTLYDLAEKTNGELELKNLEL